MSKINCNLKKKTNLKDVLKLKIAIAIAIDIVSLMLSNFIP
jgi:hypothetical protein